jgi:hypothetical protein
VAAGGWYIYRIGVPIPLIEPGDTYYVLTVTGQALVDGNLVAIVLEDPPGNTACCRPIAAPAATVFSTWSPFSFAAPVVPHTLAVLYFITYNAEQSYGNRTGLRVEFTSGYFTPE